MQTLRAITIKTQARRLKYFSIFIDNIKKRGTRKATLYQEVLKWSQKSKDSFNSLVSSTGEIKKDENKKVSNSFINYINCGFTIEIIDSYFDLITTTRMGYAFKALRQINKDKCADTYLLTNTEKIFFFYVLIKNDADRLLTTSNMIKDLGSATMDTLQEKFKVYYEDHLNEKLNHSKDSEKTKVFEAFKRVKNWRSPKRYSEDIIPPRINWLLDLELLNNKKFLTGRIELNKKGSRLFKSFTNIDDDWINKDFFKTASLLISDKNLKNWGSITDREKEALLDDPIKLSLNYFRVLNLPRLSLEQTFLFISIYILIRSNIIVEFSELEEFIGFKKRIGNKILGIRKAARKQESYLLIT
jgi:hypothetical protein